MLDLAKLATPHFTLLLRHSLSLYGVKFEAFAALPESEVYGDLTSPEALYGDIRHNLTPYCEGKVLLGRTGIMGMVSDNFISLSDKLEEDIMLYTDSILSIDDRLRVYFPDNKTLSLRIVSPDAQHAMTTLAGIYIGRVL